VLLIAALAAAGQAAGAGFVITGGGDPPQTRAPALRREAARAGAISFTESSSGLNSVGWEGGPTEVEFADWNLDGFVDIVSIGDHGSPRVNTQEHGLMVYAGDGAGKWSLTQTGDFGYGGLAIGDVNNDGVQDLAYGTHHNYSNSGCGQIILEVCLGPSLTPWATGLATAGEDWGMFGTDLADFDNDGWLDVGSNSFGCCAGVHMYRNNHDGTWKHTGVRTGGNAEHNFGFSDIDADGNVDAWASNEIGNVWLGDGKGGWTATTGIPKTSLGMRGPSTGDVDGDGDLDLAFADYTQSGYKLYLFLWDGAVWKDASAPVEAALNGSTAFHEMTQIGDVDLDGKSDLMLAGSGGFTVLRGDGGTAWTREFTFAASGAQWNAFRFGGDGDRNGYPDIAGVYESGNRNEIKFWKNDGSGVSASLMHPVGGEKFPPSAVRFIDWTAAGASTVKLELSTAGSSGPWTMIKDNVPNNGRYQWTIPNTPSKNCYVRVTAGSATATNARPFEILGSTGPPPLVTQVSAPNGGEILTSGSSFDVAYTLSGGTMPASGTLELSTAGPAGPWTKIADLAGLQAGAGAHSWTVPPTPTTTAYVRLNVQDTSPVPQSATDASNGAFTIVQPAAVLDRVEITPASATVVIGKTASFSAKAFDAKGAEIPTATFTWTLTGTIGSLTPSGASADLAATAVGSGSVDVKAEFGSESRTAQAAVTVQAAASPPLAKVTITPSSVSGNVGEAVALRARAIDTTGKEIDGAAFAWKVTGGVGSLDSANGDRITLSLEQAGSGTVEVVASFDGKDVSAKATVTVKRPFVIPWDLIFLVIGLIVAALVAGWLVSWARRKKRDEERQRQQWAQARHEQLQTAQAWGSQTWD
jgi:hypothetical protein